MKKTKSDLRSFAVRSFHSVRTVRTARTARTVRTVRSARPVRSVRSRLLVRTIAAVLAVTIGVSIAAFVSVAVAFFPFLASAESGGIREIRTEILAAAAEGAAPDTPYIVRLCLCAVLLNRMKDSRYPDDLAAVIADAGIVIVPAEEVSPRSLRAARDAMDGFDPTRGALRVLPPGAYPDADDLRIRVSYEGWIFF